MYFLVVLLLLFVAPAGSVFYEHSILHSAMPLPLLAGEWVTFWAAGVRLFIAGLRQTFQPRFTAQDIFKIEGEAVFPIVRELGFANLSMGSLALLSSVFPALLLPGAFVGGLYYLLAGVGHTRMPHRNAAENFAMVTDFAIAILLLGFVALYMSGHNAAMTAAL